MISSTLKYLLLFCFLTFATSATVAQSKEKDKKKNKTNKAIKVKKKKKKEKNSDRKENKGSNKPFNKPKKKKKKAQDKNRNNLHQKGNIDKPHKIINNPGTPSSDGSNKPFNYKKKTSEKKALRKYHNSDKLKTAPVPPRETKPDLNDTYMVKRKKTHGEGRLPNKNPIMVDIGSKRDNKNKNPRPEIGRWSGEYKMPRPFIQRYLEVKKRREMQNGSKLNIARVMNGRKQYRKFGRKPAMWTGNLKVKKLPKHAHPSLRYQFRKYKPTSAEIARNKKVKKPKYDPNEKKIWEPKEEHSTTY